jgi:polar amino acid transport system substrate-binding protein
MYHDNSVAGLRLRRYFGNRLLITVVMGFFIVSLISACQATKPEVSPTDHPVSINKNVVRITTGEWSPYDGEDLPHYGCTPWLVSEAFAQEGIGAEFGFFQWSRSYQVAKNGNWDGTVEWADTPEHREFFYLSEENLTDQEWVFFHRADYAFEWENMDDLEGKIVGITNEYVYSDAFQEIMQKGTVNFETASSDEANFRKLLAGRIDVFPMERRVGYAILQKKFTTEERLQITHYPVQFNTFKPHLLLSKAVPENHERMNQFNRGWQKLKESGRITEIMQFCNPQ